MPSKPLRSCPGKGPRYLSCPNLIKSSETCCSECKSYEKAKTKRYDQERDQSPGRKFLHSTDWRKIRLIKLFRDPLCERCLEKGLTVAATLVHHIDENQLNNDSSNHMSLCGPCHLAVHGDIVFGNDKRK